MGLEVMAVDGNAQAVGFPLAHHPVNVSTLNVPAVLDVARRFRPHGIMTVGSDRAVSAVAEVGHALGLPGLASQAAHRANSKLEMRRAFHAHAIPAPRFTEVRSADEAQEAAAGLGLPVVVKPVDNAAQRGVQRVAALEDIPSAFVEARRFSGTDTVLVEECVEGPEITVNSFSLDGHMYPVLVADRFTNPPPYLGIALAHVYPSTWARPWYERVVEITRQALQALGIDQGPGYTQLRIDEEGPKVMEIGARIGGGRETELMALLGGPDWISAQIRLALGDPLTAEDVVLPPSAREQAGIVKFIFAPPGTVTAVSGVEQAREMPGVKRVVLRARPDVLIPPRVNAEARQGYLIVLAGEREEALARAEAAAAAIRIQVRPSTGD
jgi:biotin carboxylase